MKMLKNLLGGSSQYNASELEKEGSPYLFSGETLEAGFKLSNTQSLVITSHRLMLLSRTSMTASNSACHTVPYRSIVSVDMAVKQGLTASGGTLNLYLAGMVEPLSVEFKDKDTLMQVYTGLAALICGVTA